MGRDQDQEGQRARDERVAIPLDPEVALRALLKVDPEAESSEGNSSEDPETKGRDAGG
jgi:hypothetical protein